MGGSDECLTGCREFRRGAAPLPRTGTMRYSVTPLSGCCEFAPTLAWQQAANPVLLTFDDGPSETTTPQVLAVLSAFHLRAIFFVLGQRLEKASHRDLVSRMIDDGHMVGNHSYTHANLATAARETILRELDQTQARLKELGVEERLFRPPYGAISESVLDIAYELRLAGLGWNVDPSDWDERQQPDGWIDAACDQVGKTPQSIVLLHDIQASTAAGLRMFIERLLKLGSSFPPLFGAAGTAADNLTPQWRRFARRWKVLPELQIYFPE